MTEHNVLYIVEGKDERDLLVRLWSRFDPDNRYDVYEYKTNIHVLIDSLFDGDDLDDDLEIVRELRSREKDNTARAILDKRFEYVYMIFDFDPQDSKADMRKISKMMDFFSDPADNGRLYLNYPMVESFRHIKSMPDEDFKDRKVKMEVLKKGEYKKLVDSESFKDLKQLNNYSLGLFQEVILMHLRKENYIISGLYDLMDEDTFLSMTGSELLERQIDSLEKDGSLYVINTCIFTIVEYKPSIFYALDNAIKK